ncbi:fructose transport system permease protein [Limimaricola variabilis]|uniref:Fructose transport system permease protein n=1 Tax=Limimaricola variabilis TaxID=1492771 RepID=A0ABR6HRQ2_9RHOB|nr:ABC transporter permease [Limimaricola variabilis]MBB3713054.1 fructose transport system permease protein [Limimaricola variabilis]
MTDEKLAVLRRGPADYEVAAAGASSDTAQFAETDGGWLRRIQTFLNEYPTTVPLLVLLLGVVLFSWISGRTFLHPYNLSLILQQVTIIGTVGMAQTLIILTAGIDLSVGVVMILTTVVAGRAAVSFGLPAEFIFAIGLSVGLGCGLLNGLLVAVFRLPPFIVTLGTFAMIGAMVLYVSGSQTISGRELAETTPSLLLTGTSFRIGGAQLTVGSILLLVLAAVLWFVLARTAFGRHVHAVGDAPDAARLSGINVRNTLLAVYVVAGAICAFAGWLMIGRVGAVSPTSGALANLDSITAVVIGGTSLFGGRGSVLGTLIGALIVGVFRNGLALSGADILWQEFAVGLLVILAVLLDQWIRKVSQ